MSIVKQVRDYINENFLLGASRELAGAESLLDSGVLDSTGVLELVMFLERTFGFSVADHELMPENLDSIDRIAAYVARKTDHGAASAAAPAEAG